MGRRYFYHMTDGMSLIVDRKGRHIRAKRQLEPEALSRAQQLMQGAPPQVDWSDWQVSVHDQDGYAVAHLPFPANHA
jgi:apolipoprotein N-acyltransferase